MLFVLSLCISAFAMILAFMKLAALKNMRTFMVILALGAGQIHLATLSLMTYLFVENSYRFPTRVPKKSFSFLTLLFTAILAATLLSEVTARTVSELIQLVIYLIVFLQLQTVARRSGEIEHFIRLSVPAAVVVALLGLAMSRIGVTTAPGIFLARGSNEGSTFLLLMGVLPCVFMYLKSRKLIYLFCIFIIMFAQLLATSRANVGLSGASLMAIPILLWRTLWIRLLTSFAAFGAISLNFRLVSEVWDQQQNFSTLQRIKLYEAGLELWQQRVWFGWGWGSSSQIVPQISLTDLSFPHFHSTYIQLLVELGMLGVLVICFCAAGALLMVLYGLYGKLPREYAAYLVISSLLLIGSSFVESMLFGADRALQVVILYVLSLSMIAQARNVDQPPSNELGAAKTGDWKTMVAK